MPDAVLQFINTPNSSTEPRQTESPVQWMQRCLASAHQLEQLAVQMDNTVADRDARIAKILKEYNQRKSEADKVYASDTSSADHVYSTAKNRAEAEESRLLEAIKDTLNYFKLSPRHEGVINLQATETAKELEERLKSAYETALGAQKSLKSFSDTATKNQFAFGCGGVGELVILCSALAAIFNGNAGGGFVGLLFTLIVPAGIIYHLASISKVGREARNQIVEASLLLTSRAKLEREQVFSSASSARDKSVTEAEVKLKQDKQTATVQRDNMTRDCQSLCETLYTNLTTKISSTYTALDQEIEALNLGSVRGDWTDQAWKDWEPTQRVPGCLRIGTAVPDTPRLRFHFSNKTPLALPALVDYEAGKGVVIAAGGALTEARQMAQSAILRLLATVPPASVRFVMVDPVSLGGNVAGFMALEKYEASLVGGKAWSDARHIEQALSEITEHMETVIQKYLREDYKSIAEYNAKARVKESYRIVVIFDFPVNFTEGTAKRLISIMRNGPRCGVFPIIVADNTKPLPYGISWNDLTQFAMVLQPSNAPDVVLADAVPASQGTAPSGVATSGQGVVDDYYDDDEDEEDEDE